MTERMTDKEAMDKIQEATDKFRKATDPLRFSETLSILTIGRYVLEVRKLLKLTGREG